MNDKWLAEQAIKLSQWDEETIKWLIKFAPDAKVEDGSISATGPGGVTVGFLKGADPITMAVQLGFFFAGPYWVWVFPSLLKETKRLWKQRQKEYEGEKKRK